MKVKFTKKEMQELNAILDYHEGDYPELETLYMRMVARKARQRAAVPSEGSDFNRGADRFLAALKAEADAVIQAHCDADRLPDGGGSDGTHQ